MSSWRALNICNLRFKINGYIIKPAISDLETLCLYYNVAHLGNLPTHFANIIIDFEQVKTHPIRELEFQSPIKQTNVIPIIAFSSFLHFIKYLLTIRDMKGRM